MCCAVLFAACCAVREVGEGRRKERRKEKEGKEKRKKRKKYGNFFKLKNFQKIKDNL
jgi:hypothetical protein